KEALGDDRVTGLRVALTKLGEPDSSGRPQPEETGETVEIACESIILAIGESPEPADLPEELLEAGQLKSSDEFGRIGPTKWFAGGDLAVKDRSVVHAVGSGKRAAIAMDAAMRNTVSPALNGFRWGEGGNIFLGRLDDKSSFPRRSPLDQVVSYEQINAFYFDFRPATPLPKLPAVDRLEGFSQEMLGLWEDEAIYEAQRCFNCGSCTECGNCYIFCPELSVKPDPCGYGYMVDLDYCKGCGICVQECPRAAMSLSFEE
ncbi:MAG: 4Fe-4S binding protein, partial [Desulfobacteraceae bacterium]